MIPNFVSLPLPKRIQIGKKRLELTVNQLPLHMDGFVERMKLPRNAWGYKKSKLTEDDVERMLTYVEENPLITLTEIKSKIQNELDIIISTTTTHKYLECRLYTVKKFFWSPAL